jgi:hypothetical protein
VVNEVNRLNVVHIGIKQVVQPIGGFEIIHEVNKSFVEH